MVFHKPEGCSIRKDFIKKISDITLYHFLEISVIILLRNYLVNSLSQGHGFNRLQKNALWA